MDEIMVSKRLAVGILQYLGKQPVVEMYAELAALVVRAEKAPATQPAHAESEAVVGGDGGSEEKE